MVPMQATHNTTGKLQPYTICDICRDSQKKNVSQMFGECIRDQAEEGSDCPGTNWAGIWLRGSVCDETVKLWTSVRMVALDEGWAKRGPDEEPESGRKLRPIACEEPLLKFAETLVIEEEIKDVGHQTLRNCW